MAKQLGDRVVLNSPVERIVQGRRPGHGRNAAALDVRAKRAIVAIPPTLAGADRVLAPAARPPATSSPSGCRRGR